MDSQDLHTFVFDTVKILGIREFRLRFQVLTPMMLARQAEAVSNMKNIYHMYAIDVYIFA